MYKIAIIENIHKDGIDLLEKHPDFEYELINKMKDLLKKNNDDTKTKIIELIEKFKDK